MALEELHVKMRGFDPRELHNREGKLGLLELTSNSLTTVPPLVLQLGTQPFYINTLFRTSCRPAVYYSRVQSVATTKKRKHSRDHTTIALRKTYGISLENTSLALFLLLLEYQVMGM